MLTESELQVWAMTYPLGSHTWARCPGGVAATGPWLLPAAGPQCSAGSKSSVSLSGPSAPRVFPGLDISAVHVPEGSWPSPLPLRRKPPSPSDTSQRSATPPESPSCQAVFTGRGLRGSAASRSVKLLTASLPQSAWPGRDRQSIPRKQKS